MLYDKDIREPLFEYFENRFGKIRIFEEKIIGHSRADAFFVLEDRICGVEIKSDADSYERLKLQIEYYDMYFDENYLVVGSSHAKSSIKHVPPYWGIISVEEQENTVDFYIVKEPENNPNMDWNKKISILWRPELKHIQELNNMPKYAEKSKTFVCEKILAMIDRNLLAKQVSDELFERDYEKIRDVINEYRLSIGKKKRRRRKRAKSGRSKKC